MPKKPVIHKDKPLGGGGYGDVFEGTDALDRRVAIKVIRPSAGSHGMLLDQATALARVSHPNVVTVYGVHKVIDPSTDQETDAIVMEFVEGVSLNTACSRRLQPTAALAIGLNILDGIDAIHSAGLAHGDLHEENVLVLQTGSAKIIDLLYIDSLAALSTAPRKARIQRDLREVRLHLRNLLLAAGVKDEDVNDFGRRLGPIASIASLRDSFNLCFSVSSGKPDERDIATALQRIEDSGFVKGPEYAEAVLNMIDPACDETIAIELIQRHSIQDIHIPLLKRLFARMSTESKNRVAAIISDTLDQQIPKGKWITSIRFLVACRKDLWSRLKPASAIRTESQMITDVMNGRLDIRSPLGRTSGALGTWSSSLWKLYSKPELLAQTLISLLHSDWYTQNYVAKHFIHILHPISIVTGTEDEMIRSIAAAIRNDARLVVASQHELPAAWQKRLKAEAVDPTAS